MLLNEIYLKTVNSLQKDFIENPSLEARLLISNALKIDLNSFIAEKNNLKISWFKKKKIESFIKKRLKGRSIASITQCKYFYDLKFYVNNEVLIPRPETELLIDIILKKIDKKENIQILDIGTGSANIAIVLAKKYPLSRIDAIDISKRSIRAARENIKLHKISIEQLSLLNRNVFGFSEEKKYDIIVSNPPYIRSKEIKDLIKERLVSDPDIALDGGDDGLDFYREIKDIAESNLKNNGWLFLEHGQGQRDDILKIFNNRYFYCETFDDISNIDRVIAVNKKEK